MKRLAFILMILVVPYAVLAQDAEDIGHDITGHVNGIAVDESALPAALSGNFPTSNYAVFVYDETFSTNEVQGLVDNQMRMLVVQGTATNVSWRRDSSMFAGLLVMEDGTRYIVGVTELFIIVFEQR